MRYRFKFILLFLSLLAFSVVEAQTWRYEETNDPFNGSAKSAYVVGKTTSKNYRQPMLLLSKPNGGDPILVIGNAGFYQKGTQVSIKWIFDDSDKIFSTYDWSYSNDGKSLYLEEFNHTDYLVEKMWLEEFLHYFRQSNKVLIRISDRYSVTDLTFSLSGFNECTAKIIDKETIENAHNQYLEKASNSDSLMASKMILASQLIAKAEVEFGIRSYDLDDFKARINLDFNLPPHGSVNILPAPYDSIFVKYTPFTSARKTEWDKKEIWIGTYSSADQSEQTILTPFDINSDSPLIEKYEAEQKAKETKNELYASHIYSTLNSLNIVAAADELQFSPFRRTGFHPSSFKSNVVSEIYSARDSYGHDPFELWDIAEVKIELDGDKKWKVEGGKIFLKLFNGETIKCDDFNLYEFRDEILTKARLKALGFEGGQTILITIPKVSFEELKKKYSK